VAVTGDAFEATTPQIAQERASGTGALSRTELSGYLVWGLTGVVIGIPEVWALTGSPRWPTISATVAHLEKLWSPTKAIVVALIAAAIVELITYPPNRSQYRTATGVVRRTVLGRLTMAQTAAPLILASGVWYFPAALAATAGAGMLAASLSSDTYVLGYALYGTMAVALLVVPNALAFWWAREVPFPTLFRTLEHLDRRFHPALLFVAAALTVLTIHIVAYPWP
jgi:hypothetical protein